MARMSRVRSPSFTRVDARGTLHEVVNAGTWKSVLCGRMKRHAVIGNHYHTQTDVFVFLTLGRAEVTCVNPRTGRRRRATLRRLEGILLPAGTAHALRFTAPSAFVMLKSRRYDQKRPDTFSYPVQ